MSPGNQPTDSGTSCCNEWWGSLTPVQKMWVHSHLLDLEFLASWASDIMVQDLENDHARRIDRYAPVYSNGT